MKILLLGSGGREHALAWKIAQSPLTESLYIAPGNAGTAHVGHNVALDIADFDEVASFVINEEIGMVVVGPEVPLVEGLGDYFADHALLRDVAFIGPSRDGAQLEGSKDFAKAFMQRHGIPTAAYRTFNAGQLEEATTYLATLRPPYVLKADGLAAGKGVLITPSLEQARRDLQDLLSGRFGEASEKVVIEEYLQGIECSVFVLTDGQHYLLLPEAKDYKRINEGDAGPNTGGMGSVSPVPFATPEWLKRVENDIIRPTIQGLQEEGITYRGFIFFGLINCSDGPKVIEYNCRMGDPETETVMLRLGSDIVDLFTHLSAGTLNQCQVEHDPRAAVCVMCVSGGYPGSYRKGLPIKSETTEGVIAFHAGTKMEHGQLITNGGRVIAYSAYGSTLSDAREKAMAAADAVQFEGKHFRRDIGTDL